MTGRKGWLAAALLVAGCSGVTSSGGGSSSSGGSASSSGGRSSSSGSGSASSGSGGSSSGGDACSEPVAGSKSTNPLFSDQHTADPAAMVDHCTFYVTCGHDEAGPGQNAFIMREWLLLSSKDLVHWSKTPVPDPPIATLGARVLRESDFREHLANQRSPEDASAVARDPAARREALEAYLDGVALAARGRQLGIDREPRFEAARELARQKLLSHLLAERHRDRLQGAPIDEAELRREYAAHPEEFVLEPRFTARHVLVYVTGNPAFPERGRPEAEARARAEEALGALRTGKGWDAVAARYSDEPGTIARGGLVRDGEFGRFAPEEEQAVRTQELGRPGPVFRSVFGYHVVQVESRETRRTRRSFEEVRDVLVERLGSRRAAEAREAFMARARREVGVAWREAGRRDAPLLDERAVAPHAVLAQVDGRPVRESEFRWFLQDALLPGHRASAWSRPGARRAMVAAFVDLRVLSAKARREGLDRTDGFTRRAAVVEESLLSEFAEARDGVAPPGQCTAVGPERQRERRAYLDRLRSIVGLELVSGEPGP